MNQPVAAGDAFPAGAQLEVAFTYSGPTVFIEYLVDIARAARARGLRPVLVSCGFMSEAPLAEMIEVLDGIKIDLKGLSPEFYRKVTGAELAPVLRSIRQAARAGRHPQIVNPVVPTLNDAPAMLREVVRWVAGEVGPDVPLFLDGGVRRGSDVVRAVALGAKAVLIGRPTLYACLLYTSPSPRDRTRSRMPSSA